MLSITQQGCHARTALLLSTRAASLQIGSAFKSTSSSSSGCGIAFYGSTIATDQTRGLRSTSQCPLTLTSSRRSSASSQTASSDALPRMVPSSPVSRTQFPPPSFPPSFGENQLVPVSEETSRRLHNILACFDTPVRFAFAYGSGVFSQKEAGPEHSKRPATKEGKKMIDIIMAVTHTQHWHSLNMAQHPKHYSTLSRLLGSVGIGAVQQRGAKIWYNPYVPLEDELVKYGIMSVDDLCTDLLDWETLYVSGRMHKPVALITSDARVRLAQQVNLASALRTALLLLPKEFTEVELYTQIASLSYTGDFRMSVPGGENSNKVRNIVVNQREEFRRLYAGLMRNLGTLSVEEVNGNRFKITQDDSISTRASYAARLPRCLRQKVQDHYTSQPNLDPAFLKLSLSKTFDTVPRRPSSIDREETLNAFWRAVVQRDDFCQVLLQKIAQTVKGPAWSQSLKGIYTAGFTRTLRYVGAKIGKYFEGKKESEKSQ
ncbi:related to proline transport helper PTH1 [Ustilago trichophora]|uniref:Phosphatidate cytidylyltransferase, mitochondrial n=1 Tax=Ustilago trichophora TaxID=86804 RepID=A0A5C3EL43_9BASI|nr:related to proline transport helper PTH1 [Ustilago trichophora]